MAQDPKKPQDEARLGHDRDAPRQRNLEQNAYTSRDWDRASAPTDPERRRAFREKWAATHLPNLPKKEGWHRCWISTNHPTDTPARRQALGYTFVKLEDVRGQGWNPEQHSVKDGDHNDGLVRWREMVGMEWPEEEYQNYLREFHLDMPRDMAADIYAPLQETAQRIRDGGGSVEMGEGFKEMQRYRRPDKMFE